MPKSPRGSPANAKDKGGRPTKAESRALARKMAAVFGVLGAPEDDPIRGAMWAAALARRAAWAYVNGRISAEVATQVRGVVRAVMSTIGPETMAQLDAELKRRKQKAAAPRPVALTTLAPTSAKEKSVEDGPLRGTPPRAS